MTNNRELFEAAFIIACEINEEFPEVDPLSIHHIAYETLVGLAEDGDDDEEFEHDPSCPLHEPKKTDPSGTIQ